MRWPGGEASLEPPKLALAACEAAAFCLTEHTDQNKQKILKIIALHDTHSEEAMNTSLSAASASLKIKLCKIRIYYYFFSLFKQSTKWKKRWELRRWLVINKVIIDLNASISSMLSFTSASTAAHTGATKRSI